MVDPMKAVQLAELLGSGRIRKAGPLITPHAEGFTPGEVIHIDSKFVDCPNKIKLASLLFHELEHIGQSGKGWAIWKYASSGFNYAKPLETNPYASQLNFLTQLSNHMSPGSPASATLQAEIARATMRLNNLKSTGHI